MFSFFYERKGWAKKNLKGGVGEVGKCNLKFYKLPKNWRERQM